MDRDLIREYGDAVAVVTVTRPGPGAPLDAFVESVRGATARPVAILLADTAGADAPAGVGLLRIGEDVGRAAALNRAIAGLDREVGLVAVADPGVRWCPGALDTLLEAAARHPRAGVLGPRLRDPAGRVLPSCGGLPSAGDLLRGRVPTGAPAGPVGWLSASCLLMRRAAWDSVDGFDPRYTGARVPDMGDVDLGDRLRRAGWLAVHVPAAEAVLADVVLAEGGTGGHGILGVRDAGLRRYAHDRGPVAVRALLALPGRGRRG